MQRCSSILRDGSCEPNAKETALVAVKLWQRKGGRIGLRVGTLHFGGGGDEISLTQGSIECIVISPGEK